MNRAQAEAAFDELERLARAGGTPDLAMVRRFKSLIFGLRLIPGASDNYRELLASASKWIDALHREGKPRAHDLQAYGGAGQVFQFILNDLRLARASLPNSLPEPDGPDTPKAGA